MMTMMILVLVLMPTSRLLLIQRNIITITTYKLHIFVTGDNFCGWHDMLPHRQRQETVNDASKYSTYNYTHTLFVPLHATVCV